MWCSLMKHYWIMSARLAWNKIKMQHIGSTCVSMKQRLENIKIRERYLMDLDMERCWKLTTFFHVFFEKIWNFLCDIFRFFLKFKALLILLFITTFWLTSLENMPNTFLILEHVQVFCAKFLAGQNSPPLNLYIIQAEASEHNSSHHTINHCNAYPRCATTFTSPSKPSHCNESPEVRIKAFTSLHDASHHITERQREYWNGMQLVIDQNKKPNLQRLTNGHGHQPDIDPIWDPTTGMVGFTSYNIITAKPAVTRYRQCPVDQHSPYTWSWRCAPYLWQAHGQHRGNDDEHRPDDQHKGWAQTRQLANTKFAETIRMRSWTHWSQVSWESTCSGGWDPDAPIEAARAYNRITAATSRNSLPKPLCCTIVRRRDELGNPRVHQHSSGQVWLVKVLFEKHQMCKSNPGNGSIAFWGCEGGGGGKAACGHRGLRCSPCAQPPDTLPIVQSWAVGHCLFEASPEKYPVGAPFCGTAHKSHQVVYLWRQPITCMGDPQWMLGRLC